MPFAYAFAAPPSGGARAVVHSDYAIEPFLKLFLAGWPVERIAATGVPDIVMRHRDGRLGVALAGREADGLVALGELDGVNRLADLLSHLAASRADRLVELHAASVLLGDRLALFVGPSLSGKSTLALQLAARGCLLFGDDRLLVGPLDGTAARGGDAAAAPIGMALGLTPRVRRPPHPAAGALFAQFVARHVIEAPGNIGFMPLPVGAAVAPFAATARLGALILPERREQGGVSLAPAHATVAARAMLEQIHAPGLPAGEFLAAVRALVDRLPLWLLRYDDSAKAALAVRDMMAG